MPCQDKDKDLKADPVYTQEESGYAKDAKSTPEIVVDPPSSIQDLEEALTAEIQEKVNQDLEEKVADMTIDKVDDSVSGTTISEFDGKSVDVQK